MVVDEGAKAGESFPRVDPFGLSACLWLGIKAWSSRSVFLSRGEISGVFTNIAV